MSGIRPPRSRAVRRMIGGVVVAWLVAVASIFGLERLALWAGRDRVTFGTGRIDPYQPFRAPGIVRPPTVEAGASSIDPDEEVIGIEVGGRARAYRLAAMRPRSRHVVNDVVGDAPVTVAYCDLGECVRAYTGPRASGPLDVGVAGLFGGDEMVLDVGGSLYLQESGAPLRPGSGPASIPLDRLAPTRTTWREWKRRHPGTDVYEGAR